MRGTGIHRPVEGRVIGGVCLGVGRRYGIDPVLLRVGFVVISLFAGVGLLLYVMATTVLPDAEGRVPFVRAVRDRDPKSIFLLVLLAILLISPGFGDSSGGDWGRSFVAVAAAGALVALAMNRQNGVLRQGHSGQPDTSGAANAPGATGAPGAPEPRRDGGLVFDPETGGWSPSDTVRRDQGRGATQPFTSAPPPSGPAYTPPAPPAPAPAPVSPAELAAQRAARRHRRLVSLTTVAFAVVVFTVTYLALQPNNLDVPLAFATTLGAIGLLLVVNGARRVRNRAAVGLAIAGLVLSGPMATTATLQEADVHWPGTSAGAGDVSVRPGSVAELEPGHRLGVGSMTLDLTQIPASELRALDNRQLALSLGLGDMTIVVPADASVRVVPDIGLGDISVTDNVTPANATTDSTTNGPEAPVQLGTGNPDIVINAKVDIGSLKIERR